VREENDMGRPSTFTDDLFDKICTRLENGEVLKAICRDEQMPDRSTVLRWIADDSKRKKYDAARRACVEFWSDQIIEIATDGSKDTVVDRKGRRRCDHEWVHRSRLRIETIWKLMGKIAPDRYGDKLPEAIHARQIEAAEQRALARAFTKIERVIVAAPGPLVQDADGNWVSDPDGRDKLQRRIAELEAELAGKGAAPPKPPALLEYDPGLPKRLDQQIARDMVTLIRDHVPVDGSRDPASVLDECHSVIRDALRQHFGPTDEIILAAE
jgi:hypothetical protein